jgi:tRNA-splicing ligase RtcB
MMTDTTYNVMMPDKGVPIKAWIRGVPLEDAARQQLPNVAQLPSIYKWVAAMPGCVLGHRCNWGFPDPRLCADTRSAIFV